MNFDFRADHTAATFLSPDLRQSGDGWATFLLGVVDQNSTIQSIPLQKPRLSFFGLFFHDDVKITQRLTLNLGIRYEYQSPMVDPEDRLSRFLDLSSPIPEFQGAAAPALPAEATALRGAPPIYNGAWLFTDAENRGSWNAQRALLMPRAGFAYRVNEKTALRFGYARYLIPAHLTDGIDILGSVYYPGFDSSTSGLPLIQGVPQSRFRDPFPGGLVPVTGKQYGRYTNLGATADWYRQDFRVGSNDRFNFTLQRQLPWQLVTEITYFVNFGRHLPVTRDMNLTDPRIGYEHKTALTRSVNNPFFNVLPQDKMPGQLRTRRTVQVSELLRPYPHYGALRERLSPGYRSRYQALQLQVQRPFVNGFNLVIGYNYNRERNEEYYDDLDYYLDELSFQQASNPRHRITGAAIYQLPFGRGRKYMSGMNRVLEGIVGGWALSGILAFNTGEFLRFGPALVEGDPTLSDPTKERMFDPSKFRPLPAFTRRENPLVYPGIKGMAFKNLDLTLAKEFKVTEKLAFELRMEAYNALNNFNGALPVTSVGSSQMGRIVAQRAGYFGRQFQYSGRFHW
jgi:hypothetical protein